MRLPTMYLSTSTKMAIHFSLQLWQAHPSLKMRSRSILFESGNLQKYVHFHLYLSFIKCNFNLHLGPDTIHKLLKLVMLHILYKFGCCSDQYFWRILGSFASFVAGILGPTYVENISSRSLKKTFDQRKLRLLNAYFFIFEW